MLDPRASANGGSDPLSADSTNAAGCRLEVRSESMSFSFIFDPRVIRPVRSVFWMYAFGNPGSSATKMNPFVRVGVPTAVGRSRFEPTTHRSRERTVPSGTSRSPAESPVRFPHSHRTGHGARSHRNGRSRGESRTPYRVCVVSSTRLFILRLPRRIGLHLLTVGGTQRTLFLTGLSIYV